MTSTGKDFLTFYTFLLITTINSGQFLSLPSHSKKNISAYFDATPAVQWASPPGEVTPKKNSEALSRDGSDQKSDGFDDWFTQNPWKCLFCESEWIKTSAKCQNMSEHVKRLKIQPNRILFPPNTGQGRTQFWTKLLAVRFFWAKNVGN